MCYVINLSCKRVTFQLTLIFNELVDGLSPKVLNQVVYGNRVLYGEEFLYGNTSFINFNPNTQM